MADTLHLLVPGLLGPWPFSPTESVGPLPAAPALRWLLARAESHPAPLAPEATLFELFGLPVPEAADLPVAALTRLADGGESGDGGWWLRADPVHLRADSRTAFLVDARVLAIEPDEARALVAAFNQTFAEDDLRLTAPCPDRWYLRVPADPGIRTVPLNDAIGRDIDPRLPQGPAERRWRTLLTEIQMLFHHHPVNQARAARNQPLINSVWFWGGGVCPSGARIPPVELYADDPLTQGLARLAELTASPTPKHAEDWRNAAIETRSLVVLEALRHALIDRDLDAWREQVIALERDWFVPGRLWLQEGALDALHLYPGNGRTYTLTRAARWWFWRRPRPLSADLLYRESQ
jgi:hypothetical protein